MALTKGIIFPTLPNMVWQGVVLGSILEKAKPREKLVRNFWRSQTEPSQAEPSPAEPSRAEPSRAQPSQAEPSRAKPKQAEPSQAKASQAEPGQAEFRV